MAETMTVPGTTPAKSENGKMRGRDPFEATAARIKATYAGGILEMRELERIRPLYKIDDDYTERAYLQDRRRLTEEMAALGEPVAPREFEGAAKLLGDFPRLWRGASGTTRRALLSTMFEESGIRRNEVVRVSPRPRYLELVTLVMLEGLRTGGGYGGRGERT